MQRSNRGKTHLDILVSVFLLSIIAAIAIPRFLELKSDAHEANNEGAAAELSSYIDALHDVPRNTMNKLSLAGKSIAFGADGWPERIGADGQEVLLQAGAAGDAACRDFFMALMQKTELRVITPKDSRSPKTKVNYIAVGTDTGCQFIYQGAAPEKGKAYTLRYTLKTGRITAGIEVIP